MTQQIEALKAALPLIPASKQDFASSLLGQFKAKGKLSEKQWFWVAKLASDAATAGVPDFTKDATEVGSMDGLIAIFKKAKQHLKYPAIELQLPDGSPVRLYPAGEKSSTPGFVQITDGGSYGNRKWYGRVSPYGAWEKSGTVEGDTGLASSLTALLRGMSTDPAGTAAAYGKLTGRCCFCGSKLTDEKSTAVGYGKICASHYGLSWGMQK